MIIKLNDLKKLHEEFRNELISAFEETLDKSDFIQGNSVTTFENDFAKFTGSNYAISCANGTDALIIALKALNLKNGAEVIVPALSWFSTASAILIAGGKPVFCDVCSDTLLMDTAQIEGLITKKTVGILPVHLYGQAVEMNEVKRIADKYKIWVVEDCAQAHGAKYEGKTVGTIGDIGTFSFYPGKNLGAFGDAGAITTNCQETYMFLKSFALHGQISKGNFKFVGLNSRLDSLQARILSIKLKKLKDHNKKRKQIAEKYFSGINNPLINLLKTKNNCEHVFHQFVVRVENRKKFQDYLNIKRIETGIHYSFSLNEIDCLNKSQKFKCAVSEKAKNEVVSLPMHPHLLDDEINYILECINAFR